MKAYLRMASDYLDEAKRYPSKRAAVEAFTDAARELNRYGQRLEASIHYARNREELNEYPDFTLQLGPRDGVRVERA